MAVVMVTTGVTEQLSINSLTCNSRSMARVSCQVTVELQIVDTHIVTINALQFY